MMKKLMKRMQAIQIGHNILYILLFSLMSGCWVFEMDDLGDYSFTSNIKNQSNDSLRITITKGTSPHKMDTTISKGMVIHYNGSRGVDKNDNVLTEHLFNDYFNDTYIVKSLRNDSSSVEWKGPASYMGDSVHHFYNYDSWNVELVGNEYVLEFTIYDSDFESQ